MGGKPQQVTVPTAMEGTRFDVALAALAGVSRSLARRLIESGRAGWFSGGQEAPARPNARMREGDTVWFLRETTAPVSASPIALDVRYEDPHLAVVSKPSGMVVHPGPGNHHGTLVSALLHRWPEVEGVGEHPRWGIVHRLDKDTSGLLVIARRSAAYRGLVAALASRNVDRTYLALVHGRFDITTGTIDAPIDRRRARRFVGSGGKPAVTHYRRQASWSRPPLSLLQVSLDSGRTHQIRVHMESIRRHLVGDPVYGRPASAGVDPGRVWLHAQRLRFSHPVTNETIDVTAPLPDDLRSSLTNLGPPTLGTLSGS